MGDGITHLYLGGCFDSGNNISYIATADFISRAEFHLQNSDFIAQCAPQYLPQILDLC